MPTSSRRTGHMCAKCSAGTGTHLRRPSWRSRDELRVMMNLFQPPMKLHRRVHIGSRVRRLYDAPQTPLDRVLPSDGINRQRLQVLHALRPCIDLFALAEAIDRKLTQIYRIATRGPSQIPLVAPSRKPFRIRTVWAQGGRPYATSLR